MTIVTEYRITTYSGTPFLATHYSVDKKIDGTWCVHSLYLRKHMAQDVLNVLTALNEHV